MLFNHLMNHLDLTNKTPLKYIPYLTYIFSVNSKDNEHHPSWNFYHKKLRHFLLLHNYFNIILDKWNDTILILAWINAYWAAERFATKTASLGYPLFIALYQNTRITYFFNNPISNQYWLENISTYLGKSG